MSSKTPIFHCDPSSVSIQYSSAPLNRLQSPTYTYPSQLAAHLQAASEGLHDGQTVAFPTETVYGLGANSLNPKATQRIYKIKNRPSDNPLIIHVSSLDMLQRLLPAGYTLSTLYLALIEAFWPGPLTLLFPSPNSPPPPAPQTNAIRMPNNRLALALISFSNLPLSAPSANSSGRPSPTEAVHVKNDLDGADGLACILDGGPCDVGVESTVLNALDWKESGGGSIDVLRPGGLSVEQIQRVVQQVDGGDKTQLLFRGQPWSPSSVSSASKSSENPSVPPSVPAVKSIPRVESAPSTPGMKYRHYSPQIPVYLLLPSNVFPRPDSLPSFSKSQLDDILQPIVSALLQKTPERSPRLGVLHYDQSPLASRMSTYSSTKGKDVEVYPISLGVDSASAAQRLFSGMLELEGRHPTNDRESERPPMDAILIEGCSDEGLGLAVMERVGKAVGGGGKSGELGNGQGVGTSGRFWVQV